MLLAPSRLSTAFTANENFYFMEQVETHEIKGNLMEGGDFNIYCTAIFGH